MGFTLYNYCNRDTQLFCGMPRDADSDLIMYFVGLFDGNGMLVRKYGTFL